LQELGYRIITASTAEQALELMKEHQFNLVVTDFMMPDMNGACLIAAIRSRGYDLPVILLTGFADKLGFKESNTGASLVLQKSSNEVVHLMRAVKRLLAPPARKPASSQAQDSLTRKAKAGD
jgi:CheY-like chemotaxis protein